MDSEAQVYNLLQETEEVIKNGGFSLRNIKFILNKEGLIPIAEFVQKAGLLVYHKEKGAEPIVDPALRIVGGSWWLERVVEDGIEQWAFRKKPQRPTLQAADVNLRNIVIKGD